MHSQSNEPFLRRRRARLLLSAAVSLAVLLLLCFAFALAAQQTKADGVLLTKDIVYTRAGRTKLKLDIYQPDPLPAQPAPIVVYIHGGGWQYGNKDEGADMLGALARHGYIGFSIDYRLSSEVVWPGQIYDCKAAL